MLPSQPKKSWEDTVETVKRRLGSILDLIEFDDQKVLDIINGETLSQIGAYYPKDVFWTLDLETDKTPEPNTYFIKVPEDVRVIGVQDIFNAEAFGNNLTMHSFYSTDILSSQMNANILSFYNQPVYTKYLPENKVEIMNVNYLGVPRNKSQVLLKLNIATNNPAELKGGVYNHFKDLATSDVARIAIAHYKKFTSVQTPFGEVTMELDILEDEASKRDERLELLLNNRVNSYNQKVWVF